METAANESSATTQSENSASQNNCNSVPLGQPIVNKNNSFKLAKEPSIKFSQNNSVSSSFGSVRTSTETLNSSSSHSIRASMDSVSSPYHVRVSQETEPVKLSSSPRGEQNEVSRSRISSQKISTATVDRLRMFSEMRSLANSVVAEEEGQESIADYIPDPTKSRSNSCVYESDLTPDSAMEQGVYEEVLPGDRYVALRQLMRMKSPLERVRERMHSEGFSEQDIQTFFDAYTNTPSLFTPPLTSDNIAVAGVDSTSGALSPIIKSVPKPRPASFDPRASARVLGHDGQSLAVDGKSAAFYATLIEKKRQERLADEEAVARLKPQEREKELQQREERIRHVEKKNDHYSLLGSHFVPASAVQTLRVSQSVRSRPNSEIRSSRLNDRSWIHKSARSVSNSSFGSAVRSSSQLSVKSEDSVTSSMDTNVRGSDSGSDTVDPMLRVGTGSGSRLGGITRLSASLNMKMKSL